jgi:lipoate-protein ligase A
LRFRLFVDVGGASADGAWNMAVDEALLESAMEPGGLPTIRLYHFGRPTVTFGYHQDVTRALNQAACRARGIDCVRRITGGRALLHQHELTYSVTAPPFAGSVRGVYESVTGALRNALEHLDVPIDPPASSPLPRAPEHLPCLAVPTGHEITAGGKKLVASAMRFRRRGFLQHGSILWSIDRALWAELTRLETRAPLPAIGLHELDTPGFGEASLVEAISSAFAELFGAEASAAGLTLAESERASQLAEKYASLTWTQDRFHAESRLVDNSEAVW